MSTIINYVEDIPEEIEDKIDEGICRYEKRKGISLDYKSFMLDLKDKHSKTISVLVGTTFFKEVYITDLWVDEFARGKGFGKKLLKEAEKKFIGKGFDNINLSVYSFQAPEFYKKCGFELEFTRKNKNNPKFDKYFFIKKLK